MSRGKSLVSPWHILLVVQFVGMLWVPFYNAVEPRLYGIPFFYWYQLTGVIVGAALTATVYFATSKDDDDGGEANTPNEPRESAT